MLFAYVGTALIVGFVLWVLIYGLHCYREGERERERSLHCRECGVRFDRVAYCPTHDSGTNIPHYYCPNGHTHIGRPATVGTGESMSSYLGGWTP